PSACTGPAAPRFTSFAVATVRHLPPSDVALPPRAQPEVLVPAGVAHPTAARPGVDGAQRMPRDRAAVVLFDCDRPADSAARDRAAQQERHRVLRDRMIRVDRDRVAGRARDADECRQEEERCESSHRMNGTETHESDLPSRTEEIAAALATRLTLGDVVTVSGELGTGSTTFVRGACRAL